MERWTMETTETGPWAAGDYSRVGAAENLGISRLPARPAVSRTRQVTSPFPEFGPQESRNWNRRKIWTWGKVDTSLVSWGRRLFIGIWAVPWTLRFAFCAVPCSSVVILTSYMPALYLSGCCFSSPVSALAARLDDAR
jgi:hypothetical protein